MFLSQKRIAESKPRGDLVLIHELSNVLGGLVTEADAAAAPETVLGSTVDGTDLAPVVEVFSVFSEKFQEDLVQVVKFEQTGKMIVCFQTDDLPLFYIIIADLPREEIYRKTINFYCKTSFRGVLLTQTKIGGTDMTRDESLELVTKLYVEYSLIENYQEKIRSNEAKIDELDKMTAKHYSSLTYFTPAFKASVIVAVAMLLPAYLFYGIARFLAQSNRTNDDKEAVIIILAAYIIVIGLIHLIGGFSARSKSRYMNMLERENVNAEKRKAERIIEENTELKTTLNTAKEDVSKYDDLVPLEMRNSKKMMEAKRRLLSGEDADLADVLSSLC